MNAPSLFDLDPAWLTHPSTSLEKRFAEFHRKNPLVFRRIRETAIRLVTSGRTRIGIAELAEELRYDPTLSTTGDGFKLNNSFRAFYARLLLHQLPTLLAGKIETRVQKHRKAATS